MLNLESGNRENGGLKADRNFENAHTSGTNVVMYGIRRAASNSAAAAAAAVAFNAHQSIQFPQPTSYSITFHCASCSSSDLGISSFRRRD